MYTERYKSRGSETTQGGKRNGIVCVLSVSQQQKRKMQEQCLFQTLNSPILYSLASCQGFHRNQKADFKRASTGQGTSELKMH